MPDTIWIKSVEQLHELLARYRIRAEQVGFEGDDIVFWTRLPLSAEFHKDFIVDAVELDGDRIKVAIYSKTNLTA